MTIITVCVTDRTRPCCHRRVSGGEERPSAWAGSPLQLWSCPGCPTGAACGGMLGACLLPPLTLDSRARPSPLPLLLVWDSRDACAGVRRAQGLRRGAQRAEARQAWVGDAAPGQGAGTLLSRQGLWPSTGRGWKRPVSPGYWLF